MVLEDFTGYVEEDPNSHIEKTAHHIDHDAYSNEDAWVYKDKGVDHFTDFKHDVEIKASAPTGLWRAGLVWGLSNAVQDYQTLKAANEETLWVFARSIMDTDLVLSLIESYNGDSYTSTSAVKTPATPYYLTIEKTGTAATCKIYSDSARTSLIETLQLTLHGDWNWRYVFGCNTNNDGNDYFITTDIDDLNLHEAFAHEVTITDSLGMLDSAVRSCGRKLTISDKLGMLESVPAPVAAFKQAITEILGLRDRLVTRKRRWPLGDLPDDTIQGGA